LFLLLAVGFPLPSAAAKVTAHPGDITLPTYGWAANKHPHFRGTDGKNIYPYPMLDFLSRDKTNRTYRTVVLENEYLRITFLPELGGKIHEVLDKTTGQPMFYVNHVIKPGLIGQCGAWTSGGVEWNTGPQGHTVSCMTPVDVVILPPEKDGSRSVAIGETERIYRTKWTVVVTLRPGRSFLEERIRIYNPTETVRPYYFWNCTAVPNTPGFQFIYPMTLGTDHGAEKFLHWPIHEGKDLSRGTNYQDASSIFAWHCDQDFFGSYNHDLDRGVVAYANHHQLPSKKAWTWGWGGYGTMHQADLTDDDGPYNEVQTGPLLTQGEVGRLDPCEAVEWKEWWYPVHGIGGFTFANKDLAVNAERQGTNLTLRVLASGHWKNVGVSIDLPGATERQHPDARCELSAGRAITLKPPLSPRLATNDGFFVRFAHGENTLARFRLPLDLPRREPALKRPEPSAATERAEAGWQDFLFARFPAAEANFRKALGADPKSVTARTGLAVLRLDSDPEAAMQEAATALDVAPDSGLAHYVRAVAAERRGETSIALDEAWKAALDPATAVAARALIAQLLLRKHEERQAVGALSETGPWQQDPLCRNRLAYALLQLDEKARAGSLARENLAVDPLDTFALSLLRLAGEEDRRVPLRDLVTGNVHLFLQLLAEFARYEDVGAVLALNHAFNRPGILSQDLLAAYWGGIWKETYDGPPADLPASFPYLWEDQRLLVELADGGLDDPRPTLLLGHLLFHLGRHAEGRAQWQKAAELGAEPVIAYRALGMAAKTLDGDFKTARAWLEKANQADPKDAIVARDLARVLFDLADKAADDEKRALTVQAGACLRGAFEEGQGRSDFVSLLARSYSRLGDHAATAKLLDSVRITIWEGAHEAHDLFEEAHLALGDEHLKAGRAAEALAEFDRALEYPPNLATGRLENAREGHIHQRRGDALAALGRADEAAAARRRAAEEAPSGDRR
jgi:tetratricopeptide (TPR) repeat protein